MFTKGPNERLLFLHSQANQEHATTNVHLYRVPYTHVCQVRGKAAEINKANYKKGKPSLQCSKSSSIEPWPLLTSHQTRRLPWWECPGDITTVPWKSGEPFGYLVRWHLSWLRWKKGQVLIFRGHPGLFFTPIAIETTGVLGPLSLIFMRAKTGNAKSYLLECLSVAVSKASIWGTLPLLVWLCFKRFFVVVLLQVFG